MKTKIATVLSISFIVMILDQATKWVMLDRLTQGTSVPVIPGALNLTLTFNKGIAFGALANYPDVTRQLLISVATVFALGLIIYFLVRHYHEDRVAVCALAMIIGGAAGNIIDRVRIGKVVDFIDAYYASYHWPAFNIADSAVCLGVLVLLVRPTKTEKTPQS
jgi:signal peptidase II